MNILRCDVAESVGFRRFKSRSTIVEVVSIMQAAQKPRQPMEICIMYV
jgi:hypothetical protein